MKRIGFLVEKIAETDNILHAFYKARKAKQLKKEVVAFSNSLDEISESPTIYATTEAAVEIPDKIAKNTDITPKPFDEP